MTIHIFLKILFGKTALHRRLALFSAGWKPHYTGDRTDRGIPVLIILISFVKTQIQINLFEIFTLKQKFKSIFPGKTQMQVNLFDFTCKNSSQNTKFNSIF